MSDEPLHMSGEPMREPELAVTDGVAAVHPIAARGFAAGAEAYERARPDYPPDAVAEIVRSLDLHAGRTVLELGAGTGKLTRLLVPSGARILAIEPVVEMRAALLAATASTERGGEGPVVMVDGTAEAIGLPSGSVDAVVVAQAFHWFDSVRALSEIHRVLRPRGQLLLAWNLRDESVPWVRALDERVRELAKDERQVWDGAWRAALGRSGLFGPWETRTFRHAQTLTADGLHDRVSSISFVAAAAPDVRAAVLADIDAVLAADPDTRDRERIELPYETEIMSAERRTITPGDAGIVASVNANGGGVPKPASDARHIGALGLDGDGHADSIHGGPDAAVCLYAQEAIERVREDGHQAFPGAVGENLTLLGIDWASLRAGDWLALGRDVESGALLELTEPATPCQTIAHWFTERRNARISYKVHPEDARWYARVLRPGPAAAGDPVRRMAGPHGSIGDPGHGSTGSARSGADAGRGGTDAGRSGRAADAGG